MEMKKNRKPNTTERQKNLLIEFLLLHSELVSGKNTSKTTVKQRQRLWENITETLNSEVGPNKSWSDWRKTWCDLKTNVKAKAGSNRKERNRTGGGEVNLEDFNATEIKILELLGPTIVDGHSTVKESAASTSFFIPHVSTNSSSSDTNDLVNDVVTVWLDETQNMWDDSCLNGLDDLVSTMKYTNTDEIVDNCANDHILTNQPTTSQPSISVYKGKKKNKSSNLQNTILASKTFAAISQKKSKIKADYYEQKLLLLEKIAAAEEKKAAALMSIAQRLASRQNL